MSTSLRTSNKVKVHCIQEAVVAEKLFELAFASKIPQEIWLIPEHRVARVERYVGQ